ncbi:hypothetical protein DXT76_10790 [Halobacillus trueperi]|uniref:Uncharacterized protein n=1 Tax=Halobacillus trueperi TaxID=156205 RepID=A0A3D8VNM6_9BACI|nr:hypothetical protein [Halobacillus trueperi]RDY70863.1 hypothetical protein DXT76_10790 [Halobacillus trueperi]
MSESFQELKKIYNLPDTVTVRDAADILDITRDEVRQKCQKGTLRAREGLPGSGKWKVETGQLKGQVNWELSLEKRLRIKEQSLTIAAFIQKFE